jgi:hypothetical protein
MMKAQTREMENILNAFNEGYKDGETGKPNRTQIEHG